MKKNCRLTLKTDTVRTLSSKDLCEVGGGNAQLTPDCGTTRVALAQ